jgi:hypothetical protein
MGHASQRLASVSAGGPTAQDFPPKIFHIMMAIALYCTLDFEALQRQCLIFICITVMLETGYEYNFLLLYESPQTDLL